MGVTFSNRVITLTAGAVIAVGAQALVPHAASAASAAPAAAAAAAGQDAADQRGAWLAGNTAGRGLRLEHGGAVADAIGKIFFSLGGTGFVCSGALVRSKHVAVVLTAAHCVSGGHGRWATNWTFVPGYRNGAQPYGEYTARKFFVSPKWTGPDGDSERYDVAFVRVTPATLYGRSRVASPPAGLPVTFARSQTAVPGRPVALPRTYVFGYPALPPFSGLYPNYCAGSSLVARAGSTRGTAATACSMTAGDSGGPWLANFRPGGRASRTGAAANAAIAAVTTYKLSGSTRTLYGTVLGPAARALYRAATRVWHNIPR
jgi:V8-like Glu-specific endopeptidase